MDGENHGLNPIKIGDLGIPLFSETFIFLRELSFPFPVILGILCGLDFGMPVAQDHNGKRRFGLVSPTTNGCFQK